MSILYGISYMGELLDETGSVDKELKNLIAGFSASSTGLE
ncbi:Uncharacterised protein [Legionella pneumophila]|uniref:Uncharacterized protein n=1 Tax=Legionella pneumophila TaxID=446 RepID=A0A378K234_LEGPN|nr:Uncharacterised protein [Legionella pneumophila]CZJ46434.1 Uncharacterised protein [Legionella pneumophila]CZJ76736.1 Uncharacterised protein [Legionella pneumophila]STX78330.1 Uncharacterised protein [Legionella pneumophila]